MSMKSTLLLCSVSALAALVPTSASAQSTFSFSIGSGYGGAYSGYSYPSSGYSNPYGYGGYNGNPRSRRHNRQDAELEGEHDDVHGQLEEEHAEAHDQGLDRWQHARLHQQLQYQHDYADDQLEQQHEYQHRLEEWRRRRSNYGYQGY